MAERSKRHHYVPRLLLRGFADHDGRLLTLDRQTGKTFVQPVETAAAVNDYNTISGPEGDPSDVVERAIAERESAAAPIVQRITAGGWIVGNAERSELARFMALQYLRVPHQREFETSIANALLKLQLAASGPDEIKAALEAAGHTPTEDEVDAAWRSLSRFDEWNIQLPNEHHAATTLGEVEPLASIVHSVFHWTVVRWQRQTLLTSDVPLVLVAAEDHPAWSGVGLGTAGALWFGLDRRTALYLIHRERLHGTNAEHATDGQALPGTFAQARTLNQRTSLQARRFVYAHPDDTLEDLLGEAYPLPRPSEQVMDPDTGRDLREMLVRAHEWAARHPDRPHPLSRLGSSGPPPSNARPLVIDGRTRRIQMASEAAERASAIDGALPVGAGHEDFGVAGAEDVAASVPAGDGDVGDGEAGGAEAADAGLPGGSPGRW